MKKKSKRNRTINLAKLPPTAAAPVAAAWPAAAADDRRAKLQLLDRAARELHRLRDGRTAELEELEGGGSVLRVERAERA